MGAEDVGGDDSGEGAAVLLEVGPAAAESVPSGPHPGATDVHLGPTPAKVWGPDRLPPEPTHRGAPRPLPQP